MGRESLDYRERARIECEAAFNASCPVARHAHAEMALAFTRLAEIAELTERGELSPGKVTTIADALFHWEQTEYGGHGPRPRGQR